MRKLWESVELGSLKLKNRAVMPAMGTGYTSSQGEVTPRLLAYLRRRAEGGVGLIITEVCAVHPLGKAYPAELSIYDDSHLPGLEELVRVVKHSGAAVAAQLHHVGRETFPQLLGAQPVGPSPIASRAIGTVPRELSREEIAELVQCYANAAKRAQKAGFDAVEVHGAHGYLINQFLSPYSNQREDEYGGDADGRFRFAREIVRAIRETVGKDFPVIFRFSSTELVRGGYDLDYILPLLTLLEKDGIDAFHVSCGVYDSPGNPVCPGMHHPEGFNLERAARVKEQVGVPVIVAGKMHRPQLAEEAISQGGADLVAFGRQHLADPHFLAKAAEGREEDIRFCLSCNQGCIERLLLRMQPATCVINPECGEEWRSYRKTAPGAGPFLVVGAGPAGLQAALTLREASAQVEVMEKDAQPGGQLRLASLPPDKQPLAGWLEWILRRLRSLKTELLLGQEADQATLSSRNWRGLVVATGSLPLIPSVPGGDHPQVVEARSLLKGEAECGKRALIVGAGPVGMETADYLLERGHEVTIIDEQDYPPVSPLTSHGSYLHRKIKEKGALLLSTKLERITAKGAWVRGKRGEEELEADTVIWAVGSTPLEELAEPARQLGIQTHVVGDALKPRSLEEAIREGFEAALRLIQGEESDSRN